MSHSASVDPPQTGTSRLITAVFLILAGAALGLAAAHEVTKGSLAAALALVPYLGLLCVVWWASKGNVLVTMIAGYLIAPVPADNLLPQVFIFAQDDFSLRPRDLFFVVDLFLVLAIVLTRPALPKDRLVRIWLGSLVLLAAYPVVIGLVAGAGQSVPALVQGATMPLRGAMVIVLVMWWVKRYGWESSLRDAARAILVCGGLLAAAEVGLVLLARGELTLSLGGYPVVVDGRPALPGWGNNILANFFCVCLATLTFLSHKLRWRLRWLIPLGILLFVGLAYTEVRIAMMVALVIVEVPIALVVVRKIWPRFGPLVALPVGAVTGAAMALATVTLLPLINPRFTTLTPAFMRAYVGGDAASTTDVAVATDAGGLDLGGQSLSTRGLLLRAALAVWQRNPLFGTGWNGWGWAKTQVDPSQPVAVDPHNGFTWLLADAGVVGLLLLYAVPVILVARRLDLWWLLAVPAVATALEMVNPNLRNGHFAIIVWVVVALAFAAAKPEKRYTVRQWFGDGWDWVRGRPANSVEAVRSPPPAASGEVDRADKPVVVS